MSINANDKVIQEKIQGEKASWELPAPADTDLDPAGKADTSDHDDDTGVPTNYENSERSYSDPYIFEVMKSPGRLG